jgi:hypothetical protein
MRTHLVVNGSWGSAAKRNQKLADAPVERDGFELPVRAR